MAALSDEKFLGIILKFDVSSLHFYQWLYTTKIFYQSYQELGMWCLTLLTRTGICLKVQCL